MHLSPIYMCMHDFVYRKRLYQNILNCEKTHKDKYKFTVSKYLGYWSSFNFALQTRGGAKQTVVRYLILWQHW